MVAVRSQDKLVVGFHGECLDGAVAAFAARLKFGDEAEYRPLLHRDSPPTDLRGRNLLLLDFSFEARVVDEFRLRSLRVLDHHSTHLRELRGRDGVLFDLERSGAGLAWDQLHMADPRPRLVQYVEDDDLQKWQLAHSKAVRCYLGMIHAQEGSNFAAWQQVREEMEDAAHFASMVDRGYDMYAQKLTDVKRTIEQSAQFVRFGDSVIPAVNSVNCVDEICCEFGPKYPFVIVWHGIAGGHYKYALRTAREDLDIEPIATAFGKLRGSFGGGGRKKAGAFYSRRPLLEIPGVSQVPGSAAHH